MTGNYSCYGFLRVAVISPEVRVGDVHFNTGKIIAAIDECCQCHCQLLLFPELCLTGYTCADLFYQPLLLDSARQALYHIARHHGSARTNVIVGLPVALNGRLYNCAAFVSHGEVVGLVPKTYLPNSGEYYEARWFTSDRDRDCDRVRWPEGEVPIGKDLLFQADSRPECIVGIEICEDLWAASPDSGQMSTSGATVLANLSASNEFLGKLGYRQMLVTTQSSRCLAAYIYASAGPGESSTDLVFSGHCMIAENGVLLAETLRFQFTSQIAVADIDLQRLVNERLKSSTFSRAPGGKFRVLPFHVADKKIGDLLRPIAMRPFVPDKDEERSARCREIFAIQTTALATRLRAIACTHAIIGLSGGLDSTLALLVTVKAFARLQLDCRNIFAVILPGFGTSRRTKGNADNLAALLGVSCRTIVIDQAVSQHFADIGHDPGNHDVTYENSQARERTQILMDLANQTSGIVIGTGDMSELALGWCTYNADHMSMYGVNAGVPKTLVRYLVEWCAECEFSGETATVLRDICATPFSPELLPPNSQGQITQLTENTIGPYALHDFFLYHAIRLQFSPKKVLLLAVRAFAADYSRSEILSWLRLFYRRFFQQQFKRSCLPDGPKVGTVALSPRGDWRMPSDASVELWWQELQELSTAEDASL